MGESIIAALITGVLTLAGVMIVNSKTHAVTDTKLESLTREVREYNGLARRVPVIEEQIRALEQRISELEKEKKQCSGQ